MGAPLGNLNASKMKPVYDALRKAVVQDDKKRLDAGAQILLNKIAEGDMTAWNFFRDTMEGKPSQALAVTGEDGGPVRFEKIVREIVRAKD